MCLKLPHATVSAKTRQKRASLVEPRGLSRVDQRMHRFKKQNGQKNPCLLVSFQPQWNVTDEYFFFSHTLFRKHTWYVASCVGGFLRACTYIDENGSDHTLGLLFFLAFLLLVPEITFYDVCGRMMPPSEPCKTPNIHHPSLCLCCSEIH